MEDTPFVALHYLDAAGRPAKLRAAAEHLVYVADPAQGLPSVGAARGVSELPPGGRASRADMVAVGELLVVRLPAAEEGGAPHFFTAPVTQVAL